VIHIVSSPPTIDILQDSVCYMERGQAVAYIPFSICDGDPCAEALVYDYSIGCTPIVGSLCSTLPQGGNTQPVPGGGCVNVYGVIDAGAAELGDKAGLEIVATIRRRTAYMNSQF